MKKEIEIQKKLQQCFLGRFGRRPDVIELELAIENAEMEFNMFKSDNPDFQDVTFEQFYNTLSSLHQMCSYVHFQSISLSSSASELLTYNFYPEYGDNIRELDNFQETFYERLMTEVWPIPGYIGVVKTANKK